MTNRINTPLKSYIPLKTYLIAKPLNITQLVSPLYKVDLRI
jgi:hypothetical protein